jgi:Zn-finger protein
MGTECGGDFVILDNGVKDCSNCNKPHDRVFVEEYLKAKLKGDE